MFSAIGAVGGIERRQRIGRDSLLDWASPRSGTAPLDTAGASFAGVAVAGAALRHGLLGRRRGHGHGGDLTAVLRHADERGGKDEGQGGARQDAVTSVAHRNFPQGLVHLARGRMPSALATRSSGRGVTSR